MHFYIQCKWIRGKWELSKNALTCNKIITVNDDNAINCIRFMMSTFVLTRHAIFWYLMHGHNDAVLHLPLVLKQYMFSYQLVRVQTVTEIISELLDSAEECTVRSTTVEANAVAGEAQTPAPNCQISVPATRAERDGITPLPVRVLSKARETFICIKVFLSLSLKSSAKPSWILLKSLLLSACLGCRIKSENNWTERLAKRMHPCAGFRTSFCPPWRGNPFGFGALGSFTRAHRCATAHVVSFACHLALWSTLHFFSP